jgi:tripartite-type tricarboxylate transporter receptor subunit TctC
MYKKVFVFLSALWVVCVSTNPTLAKEYPAKPIEILCTFTPGSSMDLMARIVSDIAKKYLGQPVVVINKPGASGAIAAADIVTSNPDGYKLLTGTNVFISIVLKTQKIPFDPSDLTPIVSFMEYKLGMAVKSSSPWKTLGELLDYANKNPDKLRWCHPGRGTTLQINTLLIFKKAGIQTIELPYKGSPEMISALLGGHVDASAIVYGAAKEQVKAGNVRYLTFFSDRRYSDPSDVPCAAELGFPEAARLPTLVGLYAHKNTPEEIKKTLFNAFKKTYEDPEFKKGIEKFGEEPRFEGPGFLNETIKKSEEVGTPILKELGLYVGK